MKNDLRKATVKATNKVIQVYKTSRGTWANFKDCSTEYKNEELIIGEVIPEK